MGRPVTTSLLSPFLGMYAESFFPPPCGFLPFSVVFTASALATWLDLACATTMVNG